MIGAGREQLRTAVLLCAFYRRATCPQLLLEDSRATCPQLLAFGAGMEGTRWRWGLTTGAYRNDRHWVGTAGDMLFYYGRSPVEQPVPSCSGVSRATCPQLLAFGAGIEGTRWRRDGRMESIGIMSAVREQLRTCCSTMGVLQ
jgi:hypothetical protein